MNPAHRVHLSPRLVARKSQSWGLEKSFLRRRTEIEASAAASVEDRDAGEDSPCSVRDDYALEGFRRAIYDYREREGIGDPIEEIDAMGVFWRKSR